MTIKGYRQCIKKFFRTVEKSPLEITINDLREYLSSTLDNYSKPYVYAGILRSFKIFFRDYLKRGYLVESFKFPKIPFYPKEIPTKKEIQEFYYAVSELKGQSMFLLFATTGLRITPQTLRDWFCCQMGELGVPDRYIDAFCGRVPKTILARHYTDYIVQKD